MERVNKCFVFILIGLISFFISIKPSSAQEYVNYNGIHITNSEYNTLLNLGFSEDQIYYMDEDTYNNNKDLDAKLITQTTRYYKNISPAYGIGYDVEITENEYSNATQNKETFDKGFINTTYKTITSSISQNGNKYRYNVSTLWKSMPSTRSYDIIGIGYGELLSIYNSAIYFSYTYAYSGGTYTTSSTYYNKKSLSTGGAAVYKLPSGSTLASLSANLYYDVVKATGSTITSLSICGDYAHATSNVSVNNVSDYSISIYGINLGTSLAGYYDATPCAMEYANVNW